MTGVPEGQSAAQTSRNTSNTFWFKCAVLLGLIAAGVLFATGKMTWTQETWEPDLSAAWMSNTPGDVWNSSLRVVPLVIGAGILAALFIKSKLGIVILGLSVCSVCIPTYFSLRFLMSNTQQLINQRQELGTASNGVAHGISAHGMSVGIVNLEEYIWPAVLSVIASIVILCALLTLLCVLRAIQRHTDQVQKYIPDTEAPVNISGKGTPLENSGEYEKELWKVLDTGEDPTTDI